MQFVATLLTVALLSEGLGLYFIVRSLGRRGRTLRDIGFFPARPTAYLWALIIAVVYCTATMLSIPTVADWAVRPSLLKLLAIATACTAGLFEETFFRWYIMSVLMRNRGPVTQVIASGVIFGLAHGIWAALGGPHSLRRIIGPIVTTTLLGLALAWLYLYSGRKLAPAILSHALIDIVIEPGLIIAAVQSF